RRIERTRARPVRVARLRAINDARIEGLMRDIFSGASPWTLEFWMKQPAGPRGVWDSVAAKGAHVRRRTPPIPLLRRRARHVLRERGRQKPHRHRLCDLRRADP